MTNTPDKPTPRILSTSLVKSIRLLETVIDAGEIGVSDLARLTGINKSNAHRILNTLEFLGYVEKDKMSLKYKASLRVFQMGSKVIQRIGLKDTAWPYLKDLGSRFGETINLAVLEGREVVYIEKVQSLEVLRMDLSVGRSVPAYCTALGKVLLAGLDGEGLKEYLDKTKIERKTDHTIYGRGALLDHLVEIRRQGFAIDQEELDAGITCIAAPVRNHLGKVVAAMSVAGPSTRMTSPRLDEIKVPLLDTALAVSGRLGWTGGSYEF